MTVGELFETSIPYLVIAATFIGSLFACRGWIQRLLFTIIMPAVYGLLWFLCLVVIGSIALLAPASIESIVDQLAIALATCIVIMIFLLQVIAMSKDSATSGSAYTLKFRGRKNRVTDEPELPHVVTQRRLMK